jgi:hypothetical protein
MDQWISRYHVLFYVLLNGVLAVTLPVASIVHDAPIGRALYVSMLLAICTAPLLFLRTLSGRYTLLGIFFSLYFLFFGALDLSLIIFGDEVPVVRESFVSEPELAILIGAALVLTGYIAAAGWAGGSLKPDQPDEWSDGTIMLCGLLLWLAGSASILYFQLIVTPDKSNDSLRQGLERTGPLLTFVLMLGNLVQPLGILILGYGYAKFRSLYWRALILTVVVLQVVIGLLTDIKGTAINAGALLIIVRVLVERRLPFSWIAAGILFVVVSFPISQAYRTAVLGDRGLDRAQAAANFGKALEIAVANQDKVTQGRSGERAQTFVERLSSKIYVEDLFASIDSGLPLLRGASLVAIPMAFVPRIIVPNKADLPVGQLFNHRVLKADSDAFISFSQLGEMYWNFGWPGIIVAMPLFGLLLGSVAAKWSLERGISITRILVLLATVQTLCMGFGGSMAVPFVQWLRSMAIIGLLHLVFARRGAPALPAAIEKESTPEHGGSLTVAHANLRATVPRYPNLLR